MVLEYCERNRVKRVKYNFVPKIGRLLEQSRGRVLRASKLRESGAAFVHTNHLSLRTAIKRGEWVGAARVGGGGVEVEVERGGRCSALPETGGWVLKAIKQYSKFRSDSVHYSWQNFGVTRALQPRVRSDLQRAAARDPRCIKAVSNRSYFYWELNTRLFTPTESLNGPKWTIDPSGRPDRRARASLRTPSTALEFRA